MDTIQFWTQQKSFRLLLLESGHWKHHFLTKCTAWVVPLLTMRYSWQVLCWESWNAAVIQANLKSGGYDHYYYKGWKTYDTILQYNAGSDNWEVVGQMMEERASHAVMVMDSEDFSDHCSVASISTGEWRKWDIFFRLHNRISAHISKAAILAILITLYIYWFNIKYFVQCLDLWPTQH